MEVPSQVTGELQKTLITTNPINIINAREEQDVFAGKNLYYR